MRMSATARCCWSGSGPASPLPGGGDPASAWIAAGVLAKLHLAAHGEVPFPALEDICGRLESQARDDAAYEQQARGDPARGAAGLERLEAARATAMGLSATAGRTVVLHGDFAGKNLLLSACSAVSRFGYCAGAVPRSVRERSLSRVFPAKRGRAVRP